jgi:hypothetical protein
MGGGGRSTTTHTTKENPYDDAWIYDRFDTGNTRFTELEDFMNQRQTALATPKYYDIGGGMSVKQDNLGQYFSGQLQDQAAAFNARLDEMAAASQQARRQQGSVYDNRLADISAAAGANQAALQAQQEAMARNAERARIGEAYGDSNMPGVTGVQTQKRKNLGAYGGTGSGFNRGGLRIQNLNI